MSGKLIVGSMPIGNLGDLTLRMVDAFYKCDYVLSDVPCNRAEDVLKKFKLQKKIVPLGSVNSAYADIDQINQVASDIKEGKIILLVASEGQVAISDPGVQFIQKCIKDNIPCEVLPGPSSSITAYVASGLSSGRIFIVPTVEKEKIKETFTMLKDVQYSVSVHVWAKDLKEVIEFIDENYRWYNENEKVYHANRIVAVCCDLTMPTEHIFMDWAHKIKNHPGFEKITLGTRVSLILSENIHTKECDHLICHMYRDFVNGQTEGLQ